MNRISNSALWGLLPLFFAASIAQAQSLPDAGALQQQIERERQGKLPPHVPPAQPAAPGSMQPSGAVVQVQEFRLVGNTLLTAEQLKPALAGYVGRSLDFAQLQAAAAAVAERYRSSGWIVNAYLPEQDVRGGVVTIQVVEAVFGGMYTQGSARRVSTERLRRGVEAQQAVGAHLNADALDRALLLADDLPGVSVSGALRAGQREGETDLVYKIADEPLVYGEVRADNTGARSTGATRLSSNLYVNSPAGLGDQANVSLIWTEGSDYVRLGYTVPVGYDGWQIGVNASQLVYKLADVDGNGSSDTAGLEARYPLLRSRMKNLFLLANADHKTFDNRFNGATTSQYSTDTGSLGLNGNLFDNLGGGGANSAALSWIRGQRNNQVGSSNSNFSKWHYALSRQQTVTPELALFASLEGQETQDKLDTSESFYLGGASGVRAYPSNEGSGSSGDLSKLELRLRLKESLMLTGFYDHGRVRNTDGTPSYDLHGAGVSLAWQSDAGLTVSATLAHRLGANPNPNPGGRDQDGSLSPDRFWLTATLNF